MDPHPGFGPADQALIDRLYNTKIHVTRKMRKAQLQAEYAPPEPVPVNVMRVSRQRAACLPGE